MEVKNVKLSELKLNDKNPRKIERQEMNRLMRSLNEFGFVDPIIVNEHPDRKNIIVGGHQRYMAADRLGMVEVPVTYVNLDEKKENLLNIALNKISGDWDEEKLPELLTHLQDLGADLTLTGFDNVELDSLMNEEEKTGVKEHERKLPGDKEIKCPHCNKVIDPKKLK